MGQDFKKIKIKIFPRFQKYLEKNIWKTSNVREPVSKKVILDALSLLLMSTLLKFLSSMCIIFVSDTFWAEWTYFSLKLLGCVEKSSLFIVQRFSTYLHTNDVVEINLLYIHGNDVLISSFYVDCPNFEKLHIWLFTFQ